MPRTKLSKRQSVNMKLRPEQPVPAAEAVAALKKFTGPKFDQTINVVLHLNIDPAHADQGIRGSVSLPRGIGVSKKVIAFCRSDVAPEAMKAGALKAGAEDLVAEIEKGWMDFDVAVASPDMMRVVSKLGKVLGPKGLMPSPKNGTVSPDVPTAVREFAAGKVEYRNDKGGNIHAVVGKMSFREEDLVANLEHFVHTIDRLRPAATKGVFIRKVCVSGAMTPSVQVRYVSATAAE